MKKYLLIAVMAIASVAFATAQPRAIGGRLGAFDGVSYQHGFGDSNMLEVEAGWGWGGCVSHFHDGQHDWHWGGHSVQAAVTYDWIDPFGATFPTMPKGEWHWYLGVGGAGGFNFHGHENNFGFVGAAGRCGVEYDFWFPLQLAVDFRPTLGAAFWNGGAGFYWDMWSAAFGLCVRYKFN